MAYHMRDLDLQRGRYDDLKIGARRKSLQRRSATRKPRIAPFAAPRRHKASAAALYARTSAQMCEKGPKHSKTRPT